MSAFDHRRYLETLLAMFALSPILLSGYIAVAPENFEVREYGIWSSQLTFASQPSSQDPGVLILGDSTIHAGLIPDLVAPDARSLALGGSSPIDARYLLGQYLQNHRAPEILVLSFSPRHLTDREFPFFWNRSVRYEAHSYAEFGEILSRAEAMDISLLPDHSSARAQLEWWLYRLKFPPYFLAEIKNANHLERRGLHHEIEHEMKRTRGHVFYGNRTGPHPPAPEATRHGFRATPLHDAYLRDCFAVAERAGIRVIFAPTTFSESSLAIMREDFARDYWAYIAGLARDHPEVVFADGFDSLPDDHFGDDTHVNDRGARAASARMAAAIATARGK